MPRSLMLSLLLLQFATNPGARVAAAEEAGSDGVVVKARVDRSFGGPNLLKASAWGGFEQGYRLEGNAFVCDNGADASGIRGATQTVLLNQRKPATIVATAWSRAEGVSGVADVDYSLYLDLVYEDGTPLWAQTTSFKPGTHDWQQVRVVVEPQRPVKSVSVHLLFRKHTGKVAFRDAELRVLSEDSSGATFDGVPVTLKGKASPGFQVRDVAAQSGFVWIQRQALGLALEDRTTVSAGQGGATFHDVTLRDTTGKDRAITLVYAVTVAPEGARWLDDPRRTQAVEPGREYQRTTRFHAGANGRLSLYPLGAVEQGGKGTALGIDMARPAFFRAGYNATSGELFLAYDVALTPEKPEARLRFVSFTFAPQWGFRAAFDEYTRLFPEAFRVRVPEQGLWMPFARLSQVKGVEDFGFRFKEGDEEVAWDDRNHMLTFRYTEPLTWWMSMPKSMARTRAAALGEARRLAYQGKREAAAVASSVYHDADGQPALMFRDEPWSQGAVWSMNSMPGVKGNPTDFSVKWNAELRRRLYGSSPGNSRNVGLDGEYIDSSEGYVTDELDFRRDHFAGATTPLVFDTETHRPAIFRGLIAYEYIKGIEADLRPLNRLMMANSTPDRLCWLVPLLDVAGNETDWNPGGAWKPMSDELLLYRRTLCKGKPFCFLMNTAFEKWPYALTERYMKRCLAYGIFPGFFSHNASEGHYFTRPELYDRDRPLFKKYIPLCKRVAEAGWEPITGARTENPSVHVERFGSRGIRYLTVFNDGSSAQNVTLTLEGAAPSSSRELVSGKSVRWNAGKTTLALDPEDVAVIELVP